MDAVRRRHVAVNPLGRYGEALFSGVCGGHGCSAEEACCGQPTWEIWGGPVFWSVWRAWMQCGGGMLPSTHLGDMGRPCFLECVEGMDAVRRRHVAVNPLGRYGEALFSGVCGGHGCSA